VVTREVKRLNPYLSARSRPDFGREEPLELCGDTESREMMVAPIRRGTESGL